MLVQCQRTDGQLSIFLAYNSPSLAAPRRGVIHRPLELSALPFAATSGHEPTRIEDVASFVRQLVPLVLVGEDYGGWHRVQPESMVVFPQRRSRRLRQWRKM